MKFKFFPLCIFLILLLFSCNKNKTQENIASNEPLWFTVQDIGLSVTTVNQNVLNQFDSAYIVYYHDNSFSETQKIIFTTTGKGAQLCYIAIQTEYDEYMGRSCIIDFETLNYHHITIDNPLIVNWIEAGLMPNRGIMYTDEENGTRYFAITGNNADPEESSYPVMLIDYPVFIKEKNQIAHNVIFNNTNIPMTISYSFDEEMEYYITNKIAFDYDGAHHNLYTSPDWYPFFSISPESTYNIEVYDFNFDNYMDVAIYAGAGTSNYMYNYFIYNPDEKKYYHHEEMSNLMNVWIDEETKSVKSHGKGGHAGLIYSYREYIWDNGVFTLIQSEDQDHDEELDKYVRITRTLENGIWTEQRDIFDIEDFYQE